MSDPILILADSVDGSYLRQILIDLEPNRQVDVAQNTSSLIQFNQTDTYQKALNPRLIGFCTNVIVAPQILDDFRGGCYNFHPGPPDYPGSNAASFAIYDEAQTYGVTAHEMAARVDSGAIVGTVQFAVPSVCRFLDLEILAYQNLCALFETLAPELTQTTQPLVHLDTQWGTNKRTRRDFEEMQQVTEGMSEAEIRLRWRAFG